MAEVKHIVVRNGGNFCSHCGTHQKPKLPMPVSEFVAEGKEFIKKHKDCKPTWKQPVCTETTTEDQLRWWLEHGERGLSSETIVSFLSRNYILPPPRWTFPLDPDDFRRCYLLLQTIPEYRARIDEMSVISPQWKALAENWDRLESLLEAQLKGVKNNMYEVMRGLTD